MTVAGRDDGLSGKGSISHISVPPPQWCSMPFETSFYAPYSSFDQPHFTLDETIRCCCGYSPISPLHSLIGVPKHTVIYGLTNRLNASIELLPCPVCCHVRRQIGADLGHFGLFNWNNSMIFSHELLNGFTNAYTTSETPFSAFCLTVRRTYMDHGTDNTFCSDDTFVQVWFAFTRLQELDSGMMCPTCGPSPSIIIADGISLGIHHSQMSANVAPPTHV
ncbi:hypothetical protein JAAARDRAFT_126642, partial [Jaapia argillacea MUCL 33604]